MPKVHYEIPPLILAGNSNQFSLEDLNFPPWEGHEIGVSYKRHSCMYETQS